MKSKTIRKLRELGDFVAAAIFTGALAAVTVWWVVMFIAGWLQ